MHVNRDYVTFDEMVFVATDIDTWTQEHRDRADPKRVIRCSQCIAPAVRLDHMWPYEDDHCRCAAHARLVELEGERTCEH